MNTPSGHLTTPDIDLRETTEYTHGYFPVITEYTYGLAHMITNILSALSFLYPMIVGLTIVHQY